MKIIETVIRKIPNSPADYKFSADASIWADIENIFVAKKFCVDRWQNEFSEDSFVVDGWQLRSELAMELHSESDSVMAFLMVSDEYFDFFVNKRKDIKPITKVYEDILPRLVSIGYDVCDMSMTSIFSHGISPKEADAVLNVYGLFDDLNVAISFAQNNDTQIPEHKPWFPVQIYLSPYSYSKIK